MDDPRAAADRRALQAALDAAAREAGATQALLQDTIARFTAVSEQVVSVVGGSAQQIDQQMVASLQDAIYHGRSAIAALGAATSSIRTVR
ncbi:MAG: hypothetical protein IRY85_13945 [Micromonosporaceae bacterium]|nr:hypothetical protein [Micromonosporaceae bacterium]